VIGVVGDEFVCRRLWRERSELRLRAADGAAPDIVAGEGVALDVWGVVTCVIKPLPV
jgi:SOS-response transcriptional repressor LexA